MNSAKAEQDMLCRMFGECLEGERIDGQLGDLVGAKGPASSKLFTYMRYDVELSEAGLGRIDVGGIEPKTVGKLNLTTPENLRHLKHIGERLAQRVNPDHFAAFID